MSNFHVISDLEGISVRQTHETLTTAIQLYITGDILDSTTMGMVINDDKKLRESQHNRDFKSHNLDNIKYCLDTHNVTLLLGNRDLNKLKLFKCFEIESVADVASTLVSHFNDGNLDISFDAWTTNWQGKHIKWTTSLHDWLPWWNSNTTNNVNAINGKDKEGKPVLDPALVLEKQPGNESTFYNRYKFIFVDTMGAPNSIKTIPHEIGVMRDHLDNPEYCAFVVLAIYRSLLHNEKPSQLPQLAKTYDFKTIKYKNMLYKLFLKSKMCALVSDKFLLSHGGLTKYFLQFFSHEANITKFAANFKQTEDREDREDREYREYIMTTVSTMITVSNLKEIIDLCNTTFSNWIKESYNTHNYLQCILTMTAMGVPQNPDIIKYYPKEVNESHYISPIGPGFEALIKSDLHYPFSTPIVQIFGHKPFGIGNSFYKIDNNNMLVCLDTSNSFKGTQLNGNPINTAQNTLNFIKIEIEKENDTYKLTSQSTVSVKSIELYKGEALNECTELISRFYKSDTVHNNTPFTIQNVISINNNKINYNNGCTICDKLNTISASKKCAHCDVGGVNQFQIIFHGYLETDMNVGVFTITKSFMKNIYILNQKDIEILFNTGSFGCQCVHQLYPGIENCSKVPVQSGGNYNKYLKYKTKYLELKAKKN